MSNERKTKLKIVRLLEPALCLTCRFSSIATVEVKGAPIPTGRRMLHCKRLDCDNWQTTSEDTESMTVEDDDEESEP